MQGQRPDTALYVTRPAFVFKNYERSEFYHLHLVT